jgi:hypothetical protein
MVHGSWSSVVASLVKSAKMIDSLHIQNSNSGGLSYDFARSAGMKSILGFLTQKTDSVPSYRSPLLLFFGSVVLSTGYG